MCLGTFSRRGAVACATIYCCAECASSPEGFLCNRKFLEISYYIKQAALPGISPHYRTAGSFLDGRLLSHSRSTPDFYAVVIAKNIFGFHQCFLTIFLTSPSPYRSLSWSRISL